jgi:anaerobic selenocysteine-containing dehydrogenase
MDKRTDFGQCMLCEALCGLEVEHDGSTVTKIRGDDAHVLSRGHLCPKGVALAELQHDPDRLRHPLRRVGDRFEEIDWDTALTLAADRLADVQRRHGRDAVATYFGNPAAHSYSALLFYQMFVDAVGTRNRFSAASVDVLPRLLVSYLLYGNQGWAPVPDVDRTHYFLMLGANPIVSNGSAMTAPDISTRLRRLRERGGKLVVIDPRRTETAAVADEHHFIRPGTDALFLASLLNVLFAEGLAKPGGVLPLLRGWNEIEALVAPFSPARVAGVTGIDADVTTRIARELAAAPTSVCYGRIGTSVQEFGALATWLTDLVNIATGNMDRPGGWMFATAAADMAGVAKRLGLAGSFDRWRSRVSGYPEFTGEFPAAAIAEEIETPGSGQIRALVVTAGNPVLSLPNGNRLDRALGELEFMVSIDIYLNETSRRADLVLPTTFGLERDQYQLFYLEFAVRNFAQYSPAILTKPEGLRHDWEVLGELTDRLGRAKGGIEAAKGRMRGLVGRVVGAPGVLDLLLRLGPHHISLAKLRNAPHGVDFGPLESRLSSLVGRRGVHVAPAPLVSDLARLERRLRDDTDGLVLINRRTLRSNNSWVHNAARLVSGKDRCVLQMHPQDAERRGIVSGQRVTLRSRVGEIEIPVVVTDEVMAGVVCLPHGWGHDRPGARLRVASEHPGASVNDVMDDSRVDSLSGTASFSGTPVEVEPV